MNRCELKMITDRTNTHSVKYDGLEERFPPVEGLIPMWIADMDFRCPDCVRTALLALTEENLYGYYKIPDSYYDALIQWQRQRHGQVLQKEWVRYCPGVLAGVNWLIDCRTREGDACMIFTPCYYPFKDSIWGTGRRLVTCELKNENGRYSIDYDLFEDTIQREQVKLLLFSSPHNPVGRVWTREELETVIAICRRHGVFIVCDEIHQDIILTGRRQIPIAEIGDNNDIIGVATAATKTFNLAGMVHAILVLPDRKLREDIDRHIYRVNVEKASTHSYVAIEAAYRDGGPWLDAVLEQVRSNERLALELFARHTPDVVCSPMEGTYMQWIDLGAYIQPENLERAVVYTGKVAANLGPWFYDGKSTDCHVRLNLATAPENVERAVRGLITACQSK